MRSNKPRFWTVDACITALEPQRCMTFRFGFGGLMTFEESYCVVPVPVGSRLVHSFRCTGLLSALKHRNMRKNFAKRSEEHTSELQSLMRRSYAVFCLKKKHK